MQTMVPLYGFGGGGGTGAALTVNAPAGCTVTVTKDGKTKTKVADSSGLAVFKGLASGEWTISITDGEQTAQKTVTITVDYSTAITFFSAIIHITYPEGSTCTATDGVSTLTAPDTSGTWDCVVPNAGTWTIRITNGTHTKDSDPIAITSDGQSESVSLSYGYYLFRAGSGAVVPLESYEETYGTISVGSSAITVNYSDDTSFYCTALRTKSKINLTPYSTLKMTCTPSTVLAEDYSCFGVTSTAFTSVDIEESTFSTKTRIAQSSSKKTFSVDISKLTSSLYVGFLFGGKMTVTDIWLE